MVTVTSTDGGTLSGTFGEWVNLSTSPEWSLDSEDTNATVILVQIRDLFSLEVQQSASITLNTIAVIVDVIALTDATLQATRNTDNDEGTATQSITFTTSGFFQERHNVSDVSDTLTSYADVSGHAGEWATDGAVDIGDDYEIFATVIASEVRSGDNFSGDTEDSWLSLSSERSWTLTYTGEFQFGTSSRTLTISIRRSSDQVVVATADIELIAFLDAS